MPLPTITIKNVGGRGYERYELGAFAPGHETAPIPSMEYSWPTGLTRVSRTIHGKAVDEVSIKPPWFYSSQQLFYEVRRTKNTVPTMVSDYQQLGGRGIVGAPTMRFA